MSLSFCQLNQLINEQGPPPPPPVRADRRTKILMRVLNGLKKGFGTDDAKQLGGSFTDENLRAPLPGSSWVVQHDIGGTGEFAGGQGANLDDKTINAARKLGILVSSDEGNWQLGRGIMDAIHRNEHPKPGHDFDQVGKEGAGVYGAGQTWMWRFITHRVIRGLQRAFGAKHAYELQGSSFTGEMLRAPLPGKGEPHEGQGAGLNDQMISDAKELGILVPSDEGHWKLSKSAIRDYAMKTDKRDAKPRKWAGSRSHAPGRAVDGDPKSD